MAIKINIEMEIDPTITTEIDEQIISEVLAFMNMMVERPDILFVRTSRTYEEPTAFCKQPIKEKDNGKH